MKSGIYKITNLITNLFYIGSAVDYEVRWRKHENDLNANRHDNSYLQYAWNKYGAENFEFRILEYCDKEYLIKKEQGWLDWTKCYERDVGYNLSKLAGSVKGIKWSDGSRIKLSLARKGLKHSEETKKKMSEVRKANGREHAAKMRGKKQTVEHIAKKVNAQRKRNKWPCFNGHKCRCKMCKETRASDQRFYRDKLRLIGLYP